MVEKAIIEIEIRPDQVREQLRRINAAAERGGTAGGTGSPAGASPVHVGRRRRREQGERPAGIIAEFRRSRAEALAPVRRGGFLKFAGGAFAEQALVSGARGAAGRLGAARAGGAARAAAGAGGALTAAVIAPFIASELIRVGTPFFSEMTRSIAKDPGFLGKLARAVQQVTIPAGAVLQRTEELGGAVRGLVAGQAAVGTLRQNLNELGTMKGLSDSQLDTLVQSNMRASEWTSQRELREAGARRQREAKGFAEGVPQNLHMLRELILEVVRETLSGFTRL